MYKNWNILGSDIIMSSGDTFLLSVFEKLAMFAMCFYYEKIN